MAYVTDRQLQQALADAGGAGARTAATLPTGRLEANVQEATAEVVGRLGGFALPDPGPDGEPNADTPPLLRSIIIGIAGYLATLEFYGTAEVSDRDPVVLRYTRARELLAQLAAGTLVVAGIDVKAQRDTPAAGDAAIYGGTPYLGLADGFTPDTYGRHTSYPYTGGAVWE